MRVELSFEKMGETIRTKGANLYAFAIGIVLVTVGVTFMYILPPYIIETLNGTGIFDAAAVTEANTKIAQVQGLGFAVIAIGLIFALVGVIGGGAVGRGK